MAAVSVIRCPSCGASTAPDETRCAYCGSWLLKLSPLERRAAPRVTAGGQKVWFRSLAPLYKLAAAAGGAMFVFLYFVAFDSFSETELVRLSPVWFLLVNFGLSGLYTERAVNLVLAGEQASFADALEAATASVPPIFRAGIYVVFLPPFVLLGLKAVSSPLVLSAVTTAAWGALLYAFLVGIFPSL